MTREEMAVEYKHSGYNCCQTVVKAMVAGFMKDGKDLKGRDTIGQN